jgi:hypothetical protein
MRLAAVKFFLRHLNLLVCKTPLRSGAVDRD